MGCSASKSVETQGRNDWGFSHLSRSTSMPVQAQNNKSDSYHVVALTSSTYGILKVDPPKHVEDGRISVGTSNPVDEVYEKMRNFDVPAVMVPKPWSEMSLTLPKVPPAAVMEDRRPVKWVEERDPETINMWELMEGLDDETCSSLPPKKPWKSTGPMKPFERSVTFTTIHTVNELDSGVPSLAIAPAAPNVLRGVHSLDASNAVRNFSGPISGRAGPGKENAKPPVVPLVTHPATSPPMQKPEGALPLLPAVKLTSSESAVAPTSSSIVAAPTPRSANFREDSKLLTTQEYPLPKHARAATPNQEDTMLLTSQRSRTPGPPAAANSQEGKLLVIQQSRSPRQVPVKAAVGTQADNVPLPSQPAARTVASSQEGSTLLVIQQSPLHRTEPIAASSAEVDSMPLSFQPSPSPTHAGSKAATRNQEGSKLHVSQQSRSPRIVTAKTATASQESNKVPPPSQEYPSARHGMYNAVATSQDGNMAPLQQMQGSGEPLASQRSSTMARSKAAYNSQQASMEGGTGIPVKGGSVMGKNTETDSNRTAKASGLANRSTSMVSPSPGPRKALPNGSQAIGLDSSYVYVTPAEVPPEEPPEDATKEISSPKVGDDVVKKDSSPQQKNTFWSDGLEDPNNPLIDPDLLASFEEALELFSADDWCNVRSEAATPAGSSGADSPCSGRTAERALSAADLNAKGNKITGVGVQGEDDCVKKTPFSKSLPDNKEHVDPLEGFQQKCPPGGDQRVVLYTTSLRGIRKTFEDCTNLRMILQGLNVCIDERDVSMHAEFRQELKDLAGKPVPVPRLFIKGRYIGGADEVSQLHENGILAVLVEGLPVQTSRKNCEGCGGVRFVPCSDCSGSCKIITEANEVARCPECNENGLMRCPICY